MTQNLNRRLTRLVLLFSLLFVGSAASAQEFVWAPDFPVGAQMAEIAAQDQNGELRDFTDLVGENGMLFMLSRSFDW